MKSVCVCVYVSILFENEQTSENNHRNCHHNFSLNEWIECVFYVYAVIITARFSLFSHCVSSSSFEKLKRKVLCVTGWECVSKYSKNHRFFMNIITHKRCTQTTSLSYVFMCVYLYVISTHTPHIYCFYNVVEIMMIIVIILMMEMYISVLCHLFLLVF